MCICKKYNQIKRDFSLVSCAGVRGSGGRGPGRGWKEDRERVEVMELKTFKNINIKMGKKRTLGNWVVSRIVLLCFHERRLETLFWSCNLFLDESV